MTTRPARLSLLGTIATLAAAGSLCAQSYTLTEYVDTSAQVPGIAGNVTFTFFDTETPSFENGLLCFEGRYNDPSLGYTEGVFTVDAQGQIVAIVRSTDLTSNGTAYGSVSEELLSDGSVSWVSSGAGAYLRSASGGAIVPILENGTVLPGPGQFVQSIRDCARDGDDVLLRCEDGAGDLILCRRDLGTGALTIYSQVGSPSPFPGANATMIDSFSEPMVRGGQFTARGIDTNGTRGLLTDFGSGIVGPVNTTVTSPNGLGTFSSFDESSIDSDKVVWQGRTSNASGFGIYLYDHGTGTFQTIADETVSRPGGGVFAGCFDPSLSVVDGVTTVVFQHDDGVWASINGTLVPVARPGETLAGRVVQSAVHRVAYGAAGTSTAVRVQFTDGSIGLFAAELDGCPSTREVFGSGLPGAQGEPSLEGPLTSSAALLDNDLFIEFDNVDASTNLAVLALGTGTTQLPFADLTLFVSSAQLLPVPMTNGNGAYVLTIPASPVFCNFALVAQGFPLDPTSTSTSGLLLTQTKAVRWTVGTF